MRLVIVTDESSVVASPTTEKNGYLTWRVNKPSSPILREYIINEAGEIVSEARKEQILNDVHIIVMRPPSNVIGYFKPEELN